MTMKVCMFVYNNMTHDARVMKEAKTLTDNGYDVRVIAVLDKITKPYQEMDGFRIIRVVKNPFHYKIIRLFRLTSNTSKCKTSLLFDIIIKLFNKLTNRLQPEIKNKKTSKHRRNMSKARSVCSFAYRRFVMLAYYIYCYSGIRYIRKRSNPSFREKSIRVLKIFRKPLSFCYFTFRHVVLLPYYVYCIIRKIVNWILRVIRYIEIKTIIFLRSQLKTVLMIFHRLLSFVDYYFRSFQLVMKEPADVYHAHDLNTLPVAYWARKKMGGKLVYDSHELFTETSTLSRLERVLAKYTEKRLIRKADDIITVNESIANELSTRYQVNHPTVLMNCPVITKHLNRSEDNLLRKSLNINNETPIILYHGGFSSNRGLQNLVAAALNLDRAVIVFMGWGIIEKELKDLVGTYGLGDKVKFAQPVPQKDLLNYAQSANLGVIPYQYIGLNNYYSTPNKLFEYMAAGLPVVASNFPELSNIIKGYNIGRTFNPDNPKDIADAIMSVLSDRDRYSEMKKNALRASEVFNWETESKKLLELYRNLEDECYTSTN